MVHSVHVLWLLLDPRGMSNSSIISVRMERRRNPGNRRGALLGVWLDMASMGS